VTFHSIRGTLSDLMALPAMGIEGETSVSAPYEYYKLVFLLNAGLVESTRIILNRSFERRLADLSITAGSCHQSGDHYICCAHGKCLPD
jgi:hypothetical protein